MVCSKKIRDHHSHIFPLAEDPSIDWMDQILAISKYYWLSLQSLLTVIPLAVAPAVVPALVPGELLARRAEGRPVGALSARVAAHGPAVDGARDAARRVQQPVVIVTTGLG